MKFKRLIYTRWELLLGMLIVGLFIFTAVDAPKLAPVEPPPPGTFGYTPSMRFVGDRQNTTPIPPGDIAPWGAVKSQGNSKQFDVYQAIIWGTRDALQFGLVVGGISAFLGVLIGLISGYQGGWLNQLLMRITDGFLTFPLIAGIILFGQISQVLVTPYVSIEDPTSIPIILRAVFSLETIFILLSWMPYARLTNAMVIQLKSADFIEAARALGAGKMRVIFKHLLPNGISPAIVYLSRDIGGVVLMQASLVYIGLGSWTDSPWAGLLVAGRNWVIGMRGNPLTYWWVFVPASLAIILYGIGWSLIGDGLNDLINPHTKAKIIL